MFAYCNNNPVNYNDPNGELGVLGWSFIGSVTISAVANAVSTAINGGSTKDCLLAAVAGGAGAAAGFGIAWVTGFSPQGNVVGRAVATAVSDIGTTIMTSGELTFENCIQVAIDVSMDVCFSTVGYYYTSSIKNEILQNYLNAGIDGLTDVAETYLLGSEPEAKNSRISAKTGGTTVVGRTYSYAN